MERGKARTRCGITGEFGVAQYDVERGTLSYSVDGSPYVCACSSLPRLQILRPWIAVFGGARADTVEMGPCYTGDGK